MAIRYWVGSGLSLSNTAGWATSSGGTGGASVPGAQDEARFDSNSGDATCDVADTQIGAVDLFSDYTGTLTISARLYPKHLRVYGGNVSVDDGTDVTFDIRRSGFQSYTSGDMKCYPPGRCYANGSTGEFLINGGNAANLSIGGQFEIDIDTDCNNSSLNLQIDDDCVFIGELTRYSGTAGNANINYDDDGLIFEFRDRNTWFYYFETTGGGAETCYVIATGANDQFVAALDRSVTLPNLIVDKTGGKYQYDGANDHTKWSSVTFLGGGYDVEWFAPTDELETVGDFLVITDPALGGIDFYGRSTETWTTSYDFVICNGNFELYGDPDAKITWQDVGILSYGRTQGNWVDATDANNSSGGAMRPVNLRNSTETSCFGWNTTYGNEDKVGQRTLDLNPRSFWRMGESSGNATNSAQNKEDWSATDIGTGGKGETSIIPQSRNTCWNFEAQTNPDVQIPVNAVGYGTVAFSLSIWVKTASTVSQGIFFEFGASGSGSNLLAAMFSGKLYFEITAGGTDKCESVLTTFDDELLHHLVFTIPASGQPSDIKMYADGVELSTTNAGTATKNTTNDTGWLGSNGGAGFDGWLQDCATFDRVLTESEVLAIYNAGIYGLQSYRGLVIASAPVAYWRLGTDAFNDEYGDYDLTASGSPTEVRGLIYNDPDQAIEFNGTNQYGSAAISGFRDSDSAGSIELWFQTTTTSDSLLFASSQKTSWQRFNLELNNGGQVRMLVYDGTTENRFESVKTDYNDGLAHHLVVTSDGDQYRFFIDGVEGNWSISSGSNDGMWFADIVATTDEVSIGALWANNSSYNYFDGVVDEVAVYDRALSLGEITAHYLAGVDYSGLVLGSDALHYWRMNDAVTAVDVIGDYDLTAYNTPTTAPSLIDQDPDFAISFDSGSTEYFRGNHSWPDEQGGAIEAWFKTSATSWRAIFCISNSSHSEDRLMLYVDTAHTLRVYARHNNGASYDIVGTTETWNDGEIHHVVLQSNGSSYEMWVDGVQRALTAYNGTNSGNWIADLTTPNCVTVGCRINSGGIYDEFNGIIDEVAYYDHPLSSEEIGEHYRAGALAYKGLILSESPVNYWPLDDATDWEDIVGGLDMTSSTGTPTSGTSIVKTSDASLDVDGGSDGVYRTSVSNYRENDNVGSIELWFETDGDITSENNLFTYTQQDNYNSIALRLGNPGRLAFRAKSGTDFNSWIQTDNTTYYDDQNPHHFVVTCDGSTWTIYGDAVVHATTNVVGSNSGEWFGDITKALDALTLGHARRGNTTTTHFPGRIAHCAVYDYVLTPGQIAAHYAMGSANDSGFTGQGYNGTSAGTGQIGTLTTSSGTSDFTGAGVAGTGAVTGQAGTIAADFVGSGVADTAAGTGQAGTVVADFSPDFAWNGEGAGFGETGDYLVADFIDTGTAGTAAGTGQVGTLTTTSTIHFSEAGVAGTGSGTGEVGQLANDYRSLIVLHEPAGYWTLSDAHPSSIDDTFTGTNGDAVDESLWRNYDDGNGVGTKEIQGNAMRVTLDVDTTSPAVYGVSSQHLLSGDFEIEVEFKNLDFTGSGNKYALMLIAFHYESPYNEAYAGAHETGLATQYFVGMAADGSASLSGRINTFGSIRIKRTGAVITCESKDGLTNWVTLDTAGTRPTSPCYIILRAQCNTDNTTATVDFDNFTVVSGTISPFYVHSEVSGDGIRYGIPTEENALIKESGVAMGFDGSSQWARLGFASATGGQGSVEFWCQPGSTVTSWSTLVASCDTASTNYFFNIGLTNTGKLNINLRENGTDLVILYGQQTFAADTVYHVVVTSDGSTIKAYINGTEETLSLISGTNSGQWFDDVTSRDTLSIAALERSSVVSHFDGVIDQVAIYDYALPLARVQNHYNYAPGGFTGAGVAGTGAGAGQQGTLSTSSTVHFTESGQAGTAAGTGQAGTVVADFVGAGVASVGAGVGQAGDLALDWADAGVAGTGVGSGQAGTVVADFVDVGTAGTGLGTGQAGDLSLGFVGVGSAGASTGTGQVGTLTTDFVDAGAAGTGAGTGQQGTLSLSDTVHFTGFGQAGTASGVGQNGTIARGWSDRNVSGTGVGTGQPGTLTTSDVIHFTESGQAGTGAGTGRIGTLLADVLGDGAAGTGVGTGRQGSVAADFIDAGTAGTASGQGQSGTITTSDTVPFSEEGQAGAGAGTGRQGTLRTDFNATAAEGTATAVGQPGTLTTTNVVHFTGSGQAGTASGQGRVGTITTSNVIPFTGVGQAGVGAGQGQAGTLDHGQDLEGQAGMGVGTGEQGTFNFSPITAGEGKRDTVYRGVNESMVRNAVHEDVVYRDDLHVNAVFRQHNEDIVYRDDDFDNQVYRKVS